MKLSILELIEGGKQSKWFSIKNKIEVGLFQNIKEYTLARI